MQDSQNPTSLIGISAMSFKAGKSVGIANRSSTLVLGSCKKIRILEIPFNLACESSFFTFKDYFQMLRDVHFHDIEWYSIPKLFSFSVMPSALKNLIHLFSKILSIQMHQICCIYVQNNSQKWSPEMGTKVSSFMSPYFGRDEYTV